MQKVCIILRCGTEINAVTDKVDIRCGARGRIRGIRIGGADAFLRYLDARDIAAVLCYPIEEQESEEAAADGAQTD